MLKTLPIIAIVTRETRLEGLRAKWATAKAAAFRLQQAVDHEVERRRKMYRARSGEDMAESFLMEAGAAADALAVQDEYEDEDEIYRQTTRELMAEIDLGYPIKEVDRTFLPNFDFKRCVLVVVIGPDGLVANTAKYAGGLPIIGVNPDPQRNDGVLLPFLVRQARRAVQRTLSNDAKVSEVSMAEVNTNDGQRLLAFNDFYLGNNSHVSARYTLETESQQESQSSSGVIISTGAGSTGWMSSVFNMTAGICAFAGGQSPAPVRLDRTDRRLIWAVREPFCSRHSSAKMVAGLLEEDNELIVGSQMPSDGVIFSDGIESDFLEFNSGCIARFSVSKQAARLVVG